MEKIRVTRRKVAPRSAFALLALWQFTKPPILWVRSYLVPLAALAFIVCSHSPVSATERHFTFTYEVTTADKGELEVENWVTWHFHQGRGGEANTHEFDLRHEFEYG